MSKNVTTTDNYDADIVKYPPNSLPHKLNPRSTRLKIKKNTVVSIPKPNLLTKVSMSSTYWNTRYVKKFTMSFTTDSNRRTASNIRTF